ncbi:MAG TPA: GAF domain-containing protein, partial [Acidobacteriota bacterium]|nr:GAF domain-containing protein [Acidobacteriota bacterium]
MSRKTLLFILLAATLIYRGSFFLEIFSRATLYSGLQLEVVDGRLTVKSEEELDPFGRKTAAARAGLRAGDRILQFEDSHGNVLPADSYARFSEALRRLQHENDWAIVVERNGPGGAVRYTLPVHHNPEPVNWEESLLTVFWTSLLPLVAIFTGFFIGFSKPEDDHAFLACLLFVSLSAIITVTMYLLPAGIRELFRFYESTCNAFLPYLFMRFFLSFPSPSWIDRKMPWLKTAFLAFTLVLWLVNLATSYALFYSFHFYSVLKGLLQPANIVLETGFFSMFVIGLISLILNTFRKQSPDEKRRMVILLAGVGVGIVAPSVLIGLLAMTKSNSIWLITSIAVSLTAFPAAFAYVVIRHRVLGIRLIVRRGLQYLLISRGFWIVESALVFLVLYLLVRPIMIRILPLTPQMVHTFLIAGLTLALYYALRRLNQPVMRAIDRRFFRQSYDAREILTELSQAIGRLAASPAELLQLITDRITRSLYPNRIAVFLKGHDIHQDEGDSRPRMQRMKTDQYFCVWIQHGHVDEAPRLSEYVFPEQAFVPQYLEKLAEPEALEVYVEDPRSWAHVLASADAKEEQFLQERELLEKLETRLILPLIVGARTLGLISLGERLSEEAYSREDKTLLMTVAQQAAIALDYSKLISEVAEQEKMKREMEIARQVQAQLFPQTFPVVS